MFLDRNKSNDKRIILRLISGYFLLLLFFFNYMVRQLAIKVGASLKKKNYKYNILRVGIYYYIKPLCIETRNNIIYRLRKTFLIFSLPWCRTIIIRKSRCFFYFLA